MARPLAAITGASSGIGLELARCCAERGFDLLIAANEPQIQQAAQELRSMGGVNVDAVEVDLATRAGVDRFCSAAGARPIDALLANAGRGLGHAFIDEDFEDVRRVIDTNITGTIYLIHKIGLGMRARRDGRILIKQARSDGGVGHAVEAGRAAPEDGEAGHRKGALARLSGYMQQGGLRCISESTSSECATSADAARFGIVDASTRLVHVHGGKRR